MRPSDLLTRHVQAWQAATRHQFLDAARDGTLSPQVFGIWLVQDFLFVAAFLRVAQLERDFWDMAWSGGA
jgi:thiaminase